MLVIKCNICNEVLYEGRFLKYRRSLFEWLRLIPKLMSGYFVSEGNGHIKVDYRNYHLCDNCYSKLRKRLLTRPTVIEELQNLRQDNRLRENQQYPTPLGRVIPQPMAARYYGIDADQAYEHHNTGEVAMTNRDVRIQGIDMVIPHTPNNAGEANGN